MTIQAQRRRVPRRGDGGATARAVRLAVALGLLAAALPPAGASERLARAVHDNPGMPAGIASVIQDSRGYLWIAGEQGLDRFDGAEVRPWGRERLNARVERLAAGPQGEVAVTFEGHPAHEVAGDSVEVVRGDDGTPLADVRDVAYDRAGRLWVIARGALAWRGADGRWSEAEPSMVRPGRALWLGGSPAIDGVFVSTLDGELLRVGPDGRGERLAALAGGFFTRMHVVDADTVLATFRFGPSAGLYHVARGGVTKMLPIEDGVRPTGLVQRGETTWLSLDTGVLVVGASGRIETLRPEDGFEGGGSLLVDREGSLWVTSHRGVLFQFSEPETRWWTARSGLADSRARLVHRVDGVPWAATWGGPFVYDAAHDRWNRVPTGDLSFVDPGCVDPWGALWAMATRRGRDGQIEDLLVRFRGGRFTPFRPRPRRLAPDVVCAGAADGSFWIVDEGDLLEVEPGAAAPRPAGPLPLEGSHATGLAAGDEIVVGFADGRVCRAEAAALGAGARSLEPSWRCDRVLAGGGLRQLLRTADGSLWLATDDDGVLSWDGRRLSPALAPEALGFRSVAQLAPSPSGGVWVAGRTRRVRVEPAAEGARVVEELTEAQGVAAWLGSGILEEEGGAVWLASLAGVARVPAAARRDQRRTPDVELTRVTIDGERFEPGRELDLASGRNRLDVAWSARSYREPRALRYRYRLDDDAEWVEVAESRLRFAGLGPGRYRLAVAASLDGRTWSAEPALLPFVVRAPWYTRWWAIVLAAAVVSAAGHLVYRVRVRQLLALERQRTEIAMDLHDRLGSGLASIGLMADLLADEGLERHERAPIAEKVVASARRLGGEVAEIVWSLRPGAETLDALLLFLRQRAGELFAGSATRLVFDVPDPCPRVVLSLAVRRNLQWMALEALGNAAKYADARRVEVALRPEGGLYRLAVRDDGAGFAEGAPPRGSGVGLSSLRRRAEQIGAALRIESRPGEGTSVEIVFDPRAGEELFARFWTARKG